MVPGEKELTEQELADIEAKALEELGDRTQGYDESITLTDEDDEILDRIHDALGLYGADAPIDKDVGAENG